MYKEPTCQKTRLLSVISKKRKGNTRHPASMLTQQPINNRESGRQIKRMLACLPTGSMPTAAQPDDWPEPGRLGSRPAWPAARLHTTGLQVGLGRPENTWRAAPPDRRRSGGQVDEGMPSPDILSGWEAAHGTGPLKGDVANAQQAGNSSGTAAMV
jgi:hypothetical protein